MMDCPICKLPDEATESHDGGRDRHLINCPRCGKFAISGSEFGTAQKKHADLKLSAWLRSREFSSEVPYLASGAAEKVLSGIPRYSVAEKQTLLLHAIADRTRSPEKPVHLAAQYDFVLAWCGSENELAYILDALRDRGLLSLVDVMSASDAFSLEAQITPSGWDYLDSVSRAPVLSHQGFVAMSFAAEMKPAWEKGIKPAVEKAGYAPYRVDASPHIERIDAKIITEIRSSKFLVADVTQQKPGVYFEAGFAIGLNIPVFWCVRHDELNKVHFDTRQYAHIVWKTEDDLAETLQDFIVAVLGKGPRL